MKVLHIKHRSLSNIRTRESHLRVSDLPLMKVIKGEICRKN